MSSVICFNYYHFIVLCKKKIGENVLNIYANIIHIKYACSSGLSSYTIHVVTCSCMYYIQIA